MKKKIAILGSTGSIGKTSLEIFEKDLKRFQIILLLANSNYSLIKKQIKQYKPKFFVINNYAVYSKIKKHRPSFSNSFLFSFNINTNNVNIIIFQLEISHKGGAFLFNLCWFFFSNCSNLYDKRNTVTTFRKHYDI